MMWDTDLASLWNFDFLTEVQLVLSAAELVADGKMFPKVCVTSVGVKAKYRACMWHRKARGVHT